MTEPPCAATISDTIAKPNPEPPADRARSVSTRTNRSKIRCRSASGTPRPPSLTTTTAVPSCSVALKDTVEWARRAALSARLRATLPSVLARLLAGSDSHCE